MNILTQSYDIGVPTKPLKTDIDEVRKTRRILLVFNNSLEYVR